MPSVNAGPPRELLAPRHWPVWLGLALGRLIAALPYRLQMALGRRLGDLSYLLIASRRRVVDTNLRLAFPEWDEAGRRRQARECFRSAGCGMVETMICWWGSDAKVEQLAHFEGLEHLQAAAAGGHGVILLSAHFTSLELGVRMSSMKIKLTAMYRPPSNPVIDYVMRGSRERIVGQDVIPKQDVRGLVKALRQGAIVWYAPDQSARNKFAGLVPFFGQPAMTNMATARIAEMSGAAVVPFFTLRKPDGSGIRLIVKPQLQNFPSGDDSKDAERVNTLIENVVREAPTQYFWLHRRYKTYGQGPDPYETPAA
ncbi:MAG: LpxL/LpxP family Kdo(2)-lipid IV(A) lauroyl/palmitoleoyl acyltransferase [Nevskiales bacterium]